MREESDDAEGVLVAVFFQDLVAGDLDGLRRRDVGRVAFEGPVDNVPGGSSAVVFFGIALESGREVFDGRVTLDSVLLGKAGVNGGVDGSQLDLAFELGCGLVPVGFQILQKN